jgi:hypothetical protein
MLKPNEPGTCLTLMLLCSCSALNAAGPKLPAEVPINPEAGCGGLLVVKVKLENGEELPFMVDTGSATCFDVPVAPKLGAALGTTTFQSWGKRTRVSVYAKPKLYLGDTPLVTEGQTFAYDILRLPPQLGGPVKGILGCWTPARSMLPGSTRTHHRAMFSIWAANGRPCGGMPGCTRRFKATPTGWFSSSRPMARRYSDPPPFAQQFRPITQWMLRG